MVFKPAPQLKKEILHPNHFEKMYEKTAYNLISDEVTSAMNFIFSPDLVQSFAESENNVDMTNSCSINPTSWLLTFFNKYSNIMLKTKWNLVNFDENSN